MQHRRVKQSSTMRFVHVGWEPHGEFHVNWHFHTELAPKIPSEIINPMAYIANSRTNCMGNPIVNGMANHIKTLHFHAELAPKIPSEIINPMAYIANSRTNCMGNPIVNGMANHIKTLHFHAELAPKIPSEIINPMAYIAKSMKTAWEIPS